jgi:hypothetical protein
MKSIIIIGEPRCGKTTLANVLYDRLNCQIIHGDCERVSLSLVFPELNIKENPKFVKYLETLLRKQQRDSKYSVVLESTDIKPKDIIETFNPNNNIVICLGVSKIDYNEFCDYIIKNDTENDWTKKCSKEEILNYCKEYISNSKMNESECIKNNIKYYDMSSNRTDQINEIINYIKGLL